MKIVTFRIDDVIKLGVLQNDEWIIDINLAHQSLTSGEDGLLAADLVGLLAAGAAGLTRVLAAVDFAVANPAGITYTLDQVTLLPPVPNPQKVIALGRNYAAHAAEGGAKVPEYPMLFHKTAGSLLGHGGTIIIPPITEQVDYEAELAVVIGRPCKQVAPADALDYVAGYTIANDVSARDLQRRTSQFTAGKMLDTFGPLGPALVTRDEIPDPGDLAIRSILNGQVMQDDRTSNMIFDVPFIISYISQIATLNIGDIILTGTPEGVGYPRNPPVFLKEGDEITIEIEGLGTLTNTVKNQG